MSTVAPTLSPSDLPTSMTVLPSMSPSIEPSNLPSEFPTTASPTETWSYTSTHHSVPKKDVFCIPLQLNVTNLVGVSARDFIQDEKLQAFVVNATARSIYRTIQNSDPYEIGKLCGSLHLWECINVDISS